jgi:hypothetical protein
MRDLIRVDAGPLGRGERVPAHGDHRRLHRGGTRRTWTARSTRGDGVLQQILVRFDVLGNYQDGFSGIGSMRSTSEQLGKELLTYGAMALELVLDKARLPWKLQPVSVTHIEFTTDGVERVPQQRLAGE